MQIEFYTERGRGGPEGNWWGMIGRHGWREDLGYGVRVLKVGNSQIQCWWGPGGTLSINLSGFHLGRAWGGGKAAQLL
jgi:hypothetical protein